MPVVTAAPLAIDKTVRQLSDGNGANGGGGTSMGTGTTDLISFFNATPIAQPSGATQAAIARGNAAGTIAIINATSVTPTTVATITTAEYNFTAVVSTASSSGFQVRTGDILVANKPTTLAGVGIGNCRILSTNSIGLTFSNFTGGTLTPTGQSYGFVAIRGLNPITAVLTPAAVAPNAIVEQQFTVSGLRSLSTSGVIVTKPTAQAGIDIMGSRIVGPNLLGITFGNVTAATVTPTAGESYTVLEVSGMDAISNTIGINWLAASTVTVASTTTAEQAFAITGLAALDMVVGVSKPTATAALGIVGWRVSAANSLGITFVNQTTTNTPPTTDVYSIFLYRPNPVAPVVMYTQSLAPVSVANNTTAEQTFTVTGLPASSLVWVNKPSWQSGLGIVGVRVSAVNTLAIAYGNATAATITPATETYTIMSFQLPLGDAGSTWFQPVSLAAQTTSILSNAMRTSLVNLGLVAGA